MDLALVTRFGMAGIFCTLVHATVVFAAAQGLHWPLVLANALAYAVANLASWLLQSRWTFRGHPRSRRRWLIASAGLLAASAVCGRLVDVLLPQSPAGWILALVPIVAASFFVMRHWVFAERATG